MTLKELKIGESAIVDTVGGTGALRQHFLDMGLIPGEKVTLVKFAPMGDPMELQIHGYELTPAGRCGSDRHHPLGCPGGSPCPEGTPDGGTSGPR